jgi:hypothetical protein
MPDAVISAVSQAPAAKPRPAASAMRRANVALALGRISCPAAARTVLGVGEDDERVHQDHSANDPVEGPSDVDPEGAAVDGALQMHRHSGAVDVEVSGQLNRMGGSANGERRRDANLSIDALHRVDCDMDGRMAPDIQELAGAQMPIARRHPGADAPCVDVDLAPSRRSVAIDLDQPSTRRNRPLTK